MSATSAPVRGMGTAAPAVKGGIWRAVVVHFGRAEDTAACLASLAPLGFESVVLVDNGTGAPELDGLAAGYGTVRLERSAVNGGYAAGNNLGIRIACAEGADLIAVVNNDVVVEYPSILAEAERALGAAPSLGVLSPQVFYRRDGWRPVPVNLRFERALFGLARERRGGPVPAVPQVVAPTLTFSGCCWMAPAEVLRRIGPLREDLFLYHEEMEYALRLRREGFACGQIGAGTGRVLHAGGTTAGPTPNQAYYSGRNLVLVIAGLPAPRGLLLALAAARVVWMAARCVRAGRLRSAFDGFRGFADGLRGQRGPRAAT